MRFTNRVEAGKKLAEALRGTVGADALILAIPRGGVVVGYEVAHALGLPLDVVITKKIGAPFNPELAIGAVAEDGTYLLDKSTVDMLNVPRSYVHEEVSRQKDEIRRRLIAYRGHSELLHVSGREVVVVDDGVATGSTLKAALRSLRTRGAKPLICAVPVGPPDTIASLQREADVTVALLQPEPFYAIGEFYDDFEQTSDEEVTELLARNRNEQASSAQRIEQPQRSVAK